MQGHWLTIIAAALENSFKSSSNRMVHTTGKVYILYMYNIYTMKKDNYIGTCVHCEREMLLSMLALGVYIHMYNEKRYICTFVHFEGRPFVGYCSCWLTCTCTCTCTCIFFIPTIKPY